MHKYDLHVRFDCNWESSAAIVDLYELASNCMAAKAISTPLHQLQDHVIRPLWQAFGYTCHPFMVGSAMLSLQAMGDKYPAQMVSLTVRRAYSLLLQICCSPACLLSQLMATAAIAPAPSQYNIMNTARATTQIALPADCPSHLPLLIELSHIQRIALSQPTAAGDGCHYVVAWCSGLRPSLRHMRLLQRLGITPLHPAVDRHPSHVHWNASVLHWSILKAFWPDKLAAFEARQLHSVICHDLPTEPGLDLRHCYRQAQMQAQHINSANIIPTYPSTSHQVSIQLAETNPDNDVCATGRCLLAHVSPDQVALYDATGSWILTVPLTCVASLAAKISPSVFSLSTFATAVRGLMHRPLKDIKTSSPRDLFRQEFCLPSHLMTCLHSIFAFKFEWFASALNRHDYIPTYASINAGDGEFSSLQDAYTYKWLDSGFANPGLTQIRAMAALRWAITTCYEPDPVLNLLIVPQAVRTSALQATLSHPCVQHFISLPAGTCTLPVPTFMHAHCLDNQQLPTPAIYVVLVANFPGICRLRNLNLPIINDRLRQALNASGAHASQLHTIHDVPTTLPHLPFKLSRRWRHALSPPTPTSQIPDHALRERALAEIQPQPPPLKWDAASMVYTDGSKLGASVTAAWTHPASGRSHAVQLPRPSCAQRTALRAELGAIHDALHSPHFPMYRPLTLATDSLNSQHLVSAHIARPTSLRFHKHRWLIAAIAQNLLCRVAPVRILKVRAHAGILGNEAADTLATLAHSMEDVDDFPFTDPQARGPAWVQCWYDDETLSDLDTLRQHALRHTESRHVQLLLNGPPSLRSKALQRIVEAEARDIGLHQTSSNAFWASPVITDRQKSLALQVRFNMLATRHRIAQWYPSRNLPHSCPLCFAPKDTIGHRLGQCMHVSIKAQICARHGHVVQAIADEIRVGMLANCAMLVDAECHERYQSFPANFLPADLQCSRPDIVLIENARCDFEVMPLHYRRDPRITVHLVEVGYTSDFLLHDRRQAKLEQHSDLRRNLLAFGWAKVQVHCFIVGHTGVMLQDNANHLISLGISPSRVGPFLNNIAVASLRKSCAILSCFPVNQPAPADVSLVTVQVSHPPPAQHPPLPPPTAVSPAPTLHLPGQSDVSQLPSQPPSQPVSPPNLQLHNALVHSRHEALLSPPLATQLTPMLPPRLHSLPAPQPMTASCSLPSQLPHLPHAYPMLNHPPSLPSPSHQAARKRRRLLPPILPSQSDTHDQPCLQAQTPLLESHAASTSARTIHPQPRMQTRIQPAAFDSALPSDTAASYVFDPGG